MVEAGSFPNQVNQPPIGGENTVRIFGIEEVRTVVEKDWVRVEFLISKSLTRVEKEDIFLRLQEKFHSLKKFRYTRIREMGFYIEGQCEDKKEPTEEIIKTVRREVKGLVRRYDSARERRRVSGELKRRGIYGMVRCPSCGSTQIRPLGSALEWPIYQFHAGQYFVCGICGYHGPLVVTGGVGEEVKKRGFDKGRYYPRVSSPLFKRSAFCFFAIFYLLLPVTGLLFVFCL